MTFVGQPPKIRSVSAARAVVLRVTAASKQSDTFFRGQNASVFGIDELVSLLCLWNKKGRCQDE
jgi:hypothetical protein